MVANFNAAARVIEENEALLLELGHLDPPPGLTAEDAALYLPRLLKWCQRILSDDSLGNFRTVESVGQLVPCVYVDVMTPKEKSIRKRRLSLTPVASLLSIMSGGGRYKQDQLREALNRLQRQYPGVYRQLRAKIERLHRDSNDSPKSIESRDGWRQLPKRDAARARSKRPSHKTHL